MSEFFPSARRRMSDGKGNWRHERYQLRPHDMQCHAATFASRSGAPVAMVSKLILRHANLPITQPYLGKVSGAGPSGGLIIFTAEMKNGGFLPGTTLCFALPNR
jgi:hypothetical protein